MTLQLFLQSNRKRSRLMAQTNINPEICKGCGLCMSICPQGIIASNTAALSRKGYHPAMITDMTRCIGCAMCAEMCPDCAITVYK